MALKPWEERKYQQSDSVVQAQQALQKHQQNQPAPYQSQYRPQMDNLMSQYQNRGQFNYDVNADAMYQQMLDRYIQQGKQGMMDTMGKASAMTGGYGNSYAQTAGQQTYQGYLQGAYDMMPQYYQMALDRYNQQGNDLLHQYNLVAQQEESDYGRYNDDMNRYLAEQDRLRSAYDTERAYDYNQFTDDRNFSYGVYQDDVANSRYEQELARAQVDWLLANGKDIPEDLAELSGYHQAYLEGAKKTPATGSSGSVKNSYIKNSEALLQQGYNKVATSRYLASAEQEVKNDTTLSTAQKMAELAAIAEAKKKYSISDAAAHMNDYGT